MLRSLTLLFVLVANLTPIMSLAQETPVERIQKRVKLNIRLETQNSFATTEYVFFWGIKAGFDVDRKLKFGFGYTWLQSRFFSTRFNPDLYLSTNKKAQPRFRYFSAYMEYDFYTEDRWEFSAPIEIGIGNSFYHNDQSNQIAKGTNLLTIFGLNTNYMLTKWVGFGVGLGYRVVLIPNPKMQDEFSSPYYQLKIKVLFSEVMDTWRGRKKGS